MTTKEDLIKRIDAIEEYASEAIDKIRKEIESSPIEIDLFIQIKNYSDVCRALKIKELTERDFNFLPKEQQVKALNYHKIKNIELLFNGDWKANWNDKNQKKYYPWFIIEAGLGWVFYYSCCHCSFCFGSVSYYKDEKTSIFCGKTFLNIYKAILE